MSYTLDTNILIGMIRRYPRDIFPSVWEALEETIDDGEACICPAVLDETNRGSDDLHMWAKGYPGFECAVTREELETAALISIAHPEWVRGAENAADPFIIAHAKAQSRVVVTEETRKGPGTLDKNQKIPNVADEFGVECKNFFDLARERGWTF